MTGSSIERDDPLLTFQLHESTTQLLVTLLRTLTDLAEPGADRFPSWLVSRLMQALDSGADLDLLFGVLADAIEEGRCDGNSG